VADGRWTIRLLWLIERLYSERLMGGRHGGAVCVIYLQIDYLHKLCDRIDGWVAFIDNEFVRPCVCMCVHVCVNGSMHASLHERGTLNIHRHTESQPSHKGRMEGKEAGRHCRRYPFRMDGWMDGWACVCVGGIFMRPLRFSCLDPIYVYLYVCGWGHRCFSLEMFVCM